MSEKDPRKEVWIKIYTPENETRIASPSYVKKLMGIDLSNIYNRLESMERKIDRLEAPGRQDKIFILLKEHGKHNLTWIRNRVGNFQWYDLRKLLAMGLIVESRSGTVPMYSCAGDNL